MKSLLALLAFCTLICLGCEKNSLIDSPVKIEQVSNSAAILSIIVTYQDTKGDPEGGCGGNCTTYSVNAAEVSVFKSFTDANGDSNALHKAKTNSSGKVTIDNLEAGSYQVLVNCKYGKEQKQITTAKGKVTSVYFVY